MPAEPIYRCAGCRCEVLVCDRDNGQTKIFCTETGKDEAIIKMMNWGNYDITVATCKGMYCRKEGGDANSATDEMHACPFDVDMHNNRTPTCYCCNECAAGCAQEI